mmetsp:Transcript_17816/g.35940  ORF Transcript_17816/g.35940 Transcript_17816/m.35940 type:complete len:107 (+) Transcript_17816:2142-2462(+)
MYCRSYSHIALLSIAPIMFFFTYIFIFVLGCCDPISTDKLGGMCVDFGFADVIRLVNLASPRVGDHSFAKVFNARIPNAVRVNTERDLIPGLPKFFCMFKHVGHEV